MSRFRVLIAYPNLSMMLTPSYAVGLFTTILKSLGYEVDIFDCTQYNSNLEFLGEPLTVTRAHKLLNSRKFDANALYGEAKTDVAGDFSRKIEEFRPGAIIFSTLVEDTWPQAKVLLEVASHHPHIKHIIGGVFCSMAPDAIVRDHNVQVVGTGEGEDVIVDFCEAVRCGGDTKRIPGTWSRDADGGVFRNPHRALVNINNVIPDFSLFDEKRFYRPLGAKVWKSVPLETYRGCPYTCTFCNSPAKVTMAKENEQGNFLRRKSAGTLRREIMTMIDRHTVEFFYINDDAFMARPRQEMLAIAEMMSEFRIPFWFQTRFEDIDAEKLTAIKDAGCYRISFGLEHGNERFRREKLFRAISNEKILEKVGVITESGIPYTVNNIIGFPYETRDLLFESINFNIAIETFDSQSNNIFVPYHGTVLREMAIKEGWLDPERQTTSVISESILDMPEPFLSSKEILGLQRTFPLYVRMPRSRYPEICRAEVYDDEGDRIFKSLSDEFFQMTYGQGAHERMLTYQG